MGFTSLHCARLAANLGGSIMVLGKFTQWVTRQPDVSVVDRSYSMASCAYEHNFLLAAPQGFAWSVILVSLS